MSRCGRGGGCDLQRDLTDVIDILKEMMKNDKPEQENETEAEKEE